jgi:hypothetical protein
MRNKQGITVDKVPSRDLVRSGNRCYRRLRYATPTVNNMPSLRDLRAKPCKGDTLLTVCFSLRRAGLRNMPAKPCKGDTLLTVCLSLRTRRQYL